MTEDLDTVLAAVGNHEAKALLLAAMRPDAVYRPTDLRRLLLAGQGRPVRWTCNASRVHGYAEHSLVPAGLVALRDDAAYQKTQAGAQTGDAVVGQLLWLALRHRHLSLGQLFGATNSSATTVDPHGPRTVKRGAATRLRIYAVLAAEADRLTESALAERVHEPLRLIHDHLTSLRRSNILSYLSEEAYRTLHFYAATARARTREPVPYRNERTLTAFVFHYSRERHGGAFSRSGVHAAAVALDPEWARATGLKDRISSVLNHLIDQGLIERVLLPRGSRSAVWLTHTQRVVLSDYLSCLTNPIHGTTRFMEEGRRRAQAIVTAPEYFSELIMMPYIPRNIPSDLIGIMSSILDEESYCATIDIEKRLVDAYGIRLSTERLNQLLQCARAAGVIRAERRGRAFFYSARPAAPGTPAGRGVGQPGDRREDDGADVEAAPRAGRG